MLYVVALFITLSISLLVFGVAAVVRVRPEAIGRRLTAIRSSAGVASIAGSSSGERRAQIELLLARFGKRIAGRTKSRETAGLLLVRAGFRRSTAVPIYFGSRALLMFGSGLAVGAFASLQGWSPAMIVMGTSLAAMLGWFLPRSYLKKRVRARQKEIQKALADAVDLMVVCVEAGLGMNQALARVAEEIAALSPILKEELELVNLEIRTGMSREEALRNLAERTDVADLRALTAMLIQTDRFGTSIARALRVHSDTLRTKRRQRAEEAAAKTTIKLVFPLVLFIFPAMFVVILGPAILHILNQLGSLV